MNECNEWGVIYTLDALAMYTPEDAKEAEAYLNSFIIHLEYSSELVHV